jgi:plastocyanin
MTGVLLLIGAVACGGNGASSSGQNVKNEGLPTVPGARIVAVDARNFAFAPAEITATPGEALTIQLTSTKDRHDFVVVDGTPKRIAWASQGQTALGGFNAPSTPGVYTFICTEIGHASEGMVGRLVVK